MVKTTLGWREWVSLPDLCKEKIKVKVDTGARTSALHAFFVEPFHRGDHLWVRFGLHPRQKNSEVCEYCEAIVKDQRDVTDSGGHTEPRYVIETTVVLGDMKILAEMTLTNRDTMKFRMLLGRTALKGIALVDPELSFTQGR